MTNQPRFSPDDEFNYPRDLSSYSPDALLAVRPDTGNVLKANQRAHQTIGADLSELPQVRLQTFFPDLPEGSEWSEMVQELRDRTDLLLRSRCEPRGGASFPAELNFRYVQDGADFIVVVARDISQRPELRDTSPTFSERLFKTLAHNVDQDFWIVDPEYNEFLYMNPSFRETWGGYFEDKDDLVEAFLDAVHPEDRQRIKEALSFQTEGGYDEEFRLYRPTDGELRWYRDRAFPLRDARGNLQRVVGLGEDITPRKKAQKALEQSERRFRDITDNIEETIWLVDRRLEETLYVNPYYEEMFDRPLEELQKDPRSFFQPVHEEDTSWLKEEVRKSIEDPGKHPPDYTYRIVTGEGEIRWLWTQGVPIENEAGEVVRFAGFTKDVTRRKQLEDALKKSERRFRQMAENIGQVFYLYNEDHSEKLYINPAFERIWGISSEKLEEDPNRWLDSVHPEDRERVRTTLEQKAEGGLEEPFSYEYRIVRPDGEVRWIQAQNFPIQGEGSDPDRIVGLAEDITEKKQIQKQFTKALDEKDVLLREIHHRVKNNLQVVSSLLGIQKREVEDPKAKEILERSRKRVYSMALIHQKLYQTDRLSDIDVSEYLKELTQHLVETLVFGSTEVSIEFDLQPVELDRDRMVALGIVVTELVSNALEHGFADRTAGTLSLTIERPDDDSLHLQVRDDGVGWRSDAPIDESDSLGLKLVNRLVERQLEGTLEMKEEDGITVDITLPLNQGD